jgi:hypothetical protein
MMNTHDEKLFSTTLLAACAGLTLAVFGTAASAQEATADTWIGQAATHKSRADVRSELAQARADGSIRAGAADYDFVGRSVSAKSREQVRAELLAARASGELAAINAEVYGYTPMPAAALAKAAGAATRR